MDTLTYDVMWEVSGTKEFPADLQRLFREAPRWPPDINVIGMAATKHITPDGKRVIYAVFTVGKEKGEPLPVLYGRTIACRTKWTDLINPAIPTGIADV